jgi:hypothetical protein
MAGYFVSHLPSALPGRPLRVPARSLKPDKLKPIDDMLREKPGGDCPMLKRLFITVVLIVATPRQPPGLQTGN